LSIAFALITLTLPLAAQTNISLGGLSADPNAPLEITADALSVDQDSGSAVFSGNVIIGQGDLRIAAARVQVVYDDASGDIRQLSATGGVTLVTASEAAEAQAAEYNLATGVLSLSGEVLLTQGPTALSADRMTVNLSTGTAQLDGRVRTVFQQGGE